MTFGEWYQNYYLPKQRQQKMSQSGGNAAGGEDGLSSILKYAGYGNKARQAYNYGSEIYNSLFGEGTASGAGGAAGDAGASSLYAGTEAYPAAELGAEMGSEAAAGGAGAGAADSAAGMTWGGAASVVAPLVMAYLQYQRGSGENSPMLMRQENQEKARYMGDFIKNKGAVDPQQYKLSEGIYNDKNFQSNPLSWLYNTMHNTSTGSGKSINANMSDTDIDELLYKQGITADDLKGAGIDIPDWNQGDWKWWTLKRNPITWNGQDNTGGY